MQALTPDTTLPCRVRPSPNHGDRRGRAIDAVILHYTGMPTARAAEDWLCDPASEVSAHYLVEEDGTIVQMVAEARRAWHAGRSFWRGETDLNSVSIGIEIANRGHDGGLPDFPEAQLDATLRLCLDVAARRGVRPERFLAHSDIAPSRKIDPGERFPWARFAAAGVGVWPADLAAVAQSNPTLLFGHGAAGSRIAALHDALRQWGVDIPATPCFDKTTEAAIAAFQRHFRPSRVAGFADAETVHKLGCAAWTEGYSPPRNDRA